MSTEASEQLKESTDKTGLLKSSIDKTVSWISTILAPVLLIKSLKDLQEIAEYLVENAVIGSIFIISFILILSYNILVHVNLKSKNKSSLQANQESKYFKSKKAFVYSGLALSAITVILLLCIYFMVFVNGLYFVNIKSAPTRELAVQEITSINKFLDQQGEKQLRAKAYASTATGSKWYMITIGGAHTSKDSAEQTFKKAKKILGWRMPSDARIYSTLSLSRILRNYINNFIGKDRN
jgi:hypothetical protein